MTHQQEEQIRINNYVQEELKRINKPIIRRNYTIEATKEERLRIIVLKQKLINNLK